MTQPSTGDGVDVGSQRRGTRCVGGQPSVLCVLVALVVTLALLWDPEHER